MGNLEQARDLGQTIYTQAEVDDNFYVKNQNIVLQGDLNEGKSIALVEEGNLGFNIIYDGANTNQFQVLSTSTGLGLKINRETTDYGITYRGNLVYHAGNAGTSLPAIGIGQTWQDVTSQRAFGVTYTNTTGKPIVISVLGYNNSGGSANHLRLFVDGLRIICSSLTDSNAYTERSYTAIIPNGSTYLASTAYGTVNYLEWFELR